jgi:hypothetical protein
MGPLLLIFFLFHGSHAFFQYTKTPTQIKKGFTFADPNTRAVTKTLNKIKKVNETQKGSK